MWRNRRALLSRGKLSPVKEITYFCLNYGRNYVQIRRLNKDKIFIQIWWWNFAPAVMHPCETGWISSFTILRIYESLFIHCSTILTLLGTSYVSVMLNSQQKFRKILIGNKKMQFYCFLFTSYKRKVLFKIYGRNFD